MRHLIHIILAALFIIPTALSSYGQSQIAPGSKSREIPGRGKVSSMNHSYVDLNLPSGTKWATCNIGASKPSDYGTYFAWGETTTKKMYNEINSLTNGKKLRDISGNSSYDTARSKWGGSWRIPTYDEMQELIEYCTWANTTENGIDGYRIVGRNGNSIFLPTTGMMEEDEIIDRGIFGNYWCATPDTNTCCAFCLGFNARTVEIGQGMRYIGMSIRPIIK